MAETNKVRIILLRRDAISLSDEEKRLLQEAFPGREIEFMRTDPRDYKEHAAQCDQIQPAAVVLPGERPIPVLAMEKGFAHVAFTPDGLVELEIEQLRPIFKPFIPQEERERLKHILREAIAWDQKEAVLDEHIDRLAAELDAKAKMDLQQ